MKKSIGAAIVACAVIVATMAGFGVALPATAAIGTDFNSGRIISDAIFYNTASMTAVQIQGFLDAQVPTCQASTTGPACLKDYSQTTPIMPADAYCLKAYPGGKQTAAEIILNVSLACGINPQVLLVLLQKEQSLITSTAPSQYKYDKATGFACPDTSPCDPAYSGFFYQVYYAARQFQVYAKLPKYFNYHPGVNNTIQYAVDPSCGTKTVFIENQATANLYIYTPYLPDAAALANLYGLGDACSSYGNRNFWRIFTDWFGSPVSGLDSKVATSLIYAVYNDVLARNPDPAGFIAWHFDLIGQGWSLQQVANSILFSDEYYIAQIKLAYQTVLHRGADPIGLADWLNRIQIGTASVDEVQMTFMKSLEYYQRAGSTPAGFTQALYQDLLGRAPGPAELSYWADQARLYGTARVVDGIWNSNESAARRINGIYQLFLKRPADAGGITTWTPLVIAHGNQALRSVILNSAEYLMKASTRYPQP